MTRVVWTCLSTMLVGAVIVHPVGAACDPDGIQASAAVYRICMPDPGRWNGNLIVWAHGYVEVNAPLEIPEDQLRLPDGTRLPDLATALGYAFATTSYRVNGLAVREGLEDVVELVALFVSKKGPLGRVYLVGASEGGLITALAVERYPEVFAGGLATCGPIGSFPRQSNYLGDFRVLFDYFFPGLLPGDSTRVPAELMENWDTYYERMIRPVVFAAGNEGRTLQLIRTAQLPADPANFWPTAERSFRDVLWYNVFATNDAIDKLGGQPFDNIGRSYYGSLDDVQLNLAVRRFAAEPGAMAEMIRSYDTSGKLHRTLVTLHTLRDQQVPAWHEDLFLEKARSADSLDKLVLMPVDRYGHCNFTPAEVLAAFSKLVQQTEGTGIRNAGQALKTPESRAEFDRLGRQLGLPPAVN